MRPGRTAGDLKIIRDPECNRGGAMTSSPNRPDGWSRRSFLQTTAASTMTVTLLDRARGDVAPAGETKADARMPVNMKLRVNGRTRSRRPSGRRSKGFGASSLAAIKTQYSRGSPKGIARRLADDSGDPCTRWDYALVHAVSGVQE
jgi:hypothetical protein